MPSEFSSRPGCRAESSSRPGCRAESSSRPGCRAEFSSRPGYRAEIERLLRQVHAPRVEPPSVDPGLERELLAILHARGAGLTRLPAAEPAGFRWFEQPRLALALAALLMVIVGACVLPTSYEVPLGLSLEITTRAELPHAEIAKFLRERGEAGEVEVFVIAREHGGEHAGERETRMMIRMWDHELVRGELDHELREAFPELHDATIVETALEGEVETVWGRRIAHRAFHVALREADVEQAREHLLMQLRAQGVNSEQVVVEIDDRPDGRREIRVEIERELSSDEELSLPLDGWALEPELVSRPGNRADGD